MKQRKTFSGWLTNKYQLVIRSEEDFAEKRSFNFTYAKLLVFAVVFLIIIFSLVIFAVNTFLSQWFDPRYTQRQNRKMLLELSQEIDSLSYEIHRKDQYINVFRTMLEGGETLNIDSIKTVSDTKVAEVNIDKKAPIDSAIRMEFENQDYELSAYSREDELLDVFLFKPINGVVTNGYDESKDHYAIDIVSKPDEPIKSIASGSVILASWTDDSGYVIAIQHENNLISVYKHNAVILKKVGNFVEAGEIVAIVGNSGELTSGPHLHFEMWHNGKSINPLNYINF